MRFLRFALFTISLLSCFAWAGQSDPSSDFFKAYVEAMNSGSHDKMASFISSHFSTGQDLESRVARMQGFAKQAAPLTLQKTRVAGIGFWKALAQDSHGMTLTMQAHVVDGNKVDRLMLAPGDSFEEDPPKDYSGWKDLNSLTRDICNSTKSPGMVVAVIRDGHAEEAVSGIRRVGSTEAAEADDPWSIGSIGKPICSTVIGRLVEMGKLRWDTTLGEALPNIAMRPEYKPTTLEQIMHHRGGIPQDLEFDGETVSKIVAGATDPMKMRLNYAADILSRAPIGKPGEKFAYSNAGYALLGVIAEQTMGKPYEELVKELVFEPLGLKNSYTSMDKLPAGRPSGHIPGPKGLEVENMTGPLEILVAPAGGGMFMSAMDLAKFGAAHLKGLRGEDGLLKATTVRHLHDALPGDGLDYACGWGIETFPGIEKFHGHNGSNGTFRAQLCIFPNSNLVVASIVNRGGESEPSAPLQAALAIAGRYAKVR
jgi:CubicO group peptidase (beta-lactamase class C family)